MCIFFFKLRITVKLLLFYLKREKVLSRGLIMWDLQFLTYLQKYH